MFGHQDQADNNGNAAGPGQQPPANDDIDMHMQDLNDMNNQSFSAPPAHDPTQPSPYSPLPPMPPANNQGQAVTLPDEPAHQPVNLVDLKGKALDELYPIIHKLDLSAEDNFKTLMMMIQATDNKDLIGQAYEAAEKIEDEGARAKALLDIVNEINYFTNHPSIDQ